MEDADEPPSRQKKSNLAKTIEHIDISGTLLKPNLEKGIIGYCNMDVSDTQTSYGYPATIRKISKANNPYGQISEVIGTHLLTPTTLNGEHRVIAGANNDFAKCGTEDARIKQGPDGNLYIIGIAFDGQDPRMVAYITSPDFKNIQYLGIVGPQISQERAIDIVGPKTLLGKIIQKEHQSSKRKNALLQDKDASLFFNNRDIGLFGRKAGCINYHPIREEKNKSATTPLTHYQITDSIKELQRPDYWENELENLRKRTIMTPEENWGKIGLGSAPGQDNIGTCHRTFKRVIGDVECWIYQGSFFEFDPINKKVISRLRSALFTPTPEDIFTEYSDRKLKIMKYVSFPMGKINHGNTKFVYIGNADNRTQFRSTSGEWLKRELRDPHNTQRFLNPEMAA
jgi:predicted GH43/DUF377 family glycosyl hydrolase